MYIKALLNYYTNTSPRINVIRVYAKHLPMNILVQSIRLRLYQLRYSVSGYICIVLLAVGVCHMFKSGVGFLVCRMSRGIYMYVHSVCTIDNQFVSNLLDTQAMLSGAVHKAVSDRATYG